MIYTISSYKKRKYDSYISFDIDESVISNDSIGDQIGISNDNENLLWFHEDLDLDDDEILNFIDNYFNDHMKLLLKIQKVINEK